MPIVTDRKLIIKGLRKEYQTLVDLVPETYLEQCIKLGHEVRRLKEETPQGEFEAQFARGKEQRSDPDKVPFSVRTGQDFMAIANHPYVGNAGHAPHLPKDYTTLRKLCAIRDPGGNDQKTIARFEKVVKKNLIHPTMDRDEVAFVIHMSKPPSERDKFTEPEIVVKRRWNTALRAIDKLNSTQLVDLYNELCKRLGREAA